MRKVVSIFFCTMLMGFIACSESAEQESQASTHEAHNMADGHDHSAHDHAEHNHAEHAASMSVPDSIQVVKGEGALEGMVYIPAGAYLMGGDNEQARPDEFPKHKVKLNAFWMDASEVTNAQFRAFVEATGYVTTAETAPDWEEMKKQLPPGTPKPPDSVLVPASLVFTPPDRPVSLNYFGQWWSWVPGANWRSPNGPGSSIEGKDDHPVVQVSYFDAQAYAQWAGKRLPTEAEWEYAARGAIDNGIYPWGQEHIDQGPIKANYFQGNFPNQNDVKDQFEGTAPVQNFEPNAYGLYDMSGNVWEWCADWYHYDYYKEVNFPQGVENPVGPPVSFDPDEPTVPKRVNRGGSYLCNDVYCSGYRVAARMKTSPDSGLGHLGFRCVKDAD